MVHFLFIFAEICQAGMFYISLAYVNLWHNNTWLPDGHYLFVC